MAAVNLAFKAPSAVIWALYHTLRLENSAEIDARNHFEKTRRVLCTIS